MTGEGHGCRCGSPEEHRALVARVDRSFEQDRDRALFALNVATSEALRVRATAATNGHRSKPSAAIGSAQPSGANGTAQERREP